MLAWKKPNTVQMRHWQLIAFALILIICIPAAHADGIFVRKADTRYDGKVYRLDASINYLLSEQVLDALHSGVRISLIVDIEVRKESFYLWDDTVLKLAQRYVIRYFPLAEQYVVENVNSGTRDIYHNVLEALMVLGEIRQLPVFDVSMLESGAKYTAQLRARVDIDDLPTPLRLLAYVSPGWRLQSEWYQWPLKR